MARTDKDRNRDKKKTTIEDYRKGRRKSLRSLRESRGDPTTPMAQPHKTNGITRRGRKTTPGILLRG